MHFETNTDRAPTPAVRGGVLHLGALLKRLSSSRKPGRFTFVFSAKGAVFIQNLGHRPRNMFTEMF